MLKRRLKEKYHGHCGVLPIGFELCARGCGPAKSDRAATTQKARRTQGSDVILVKCFAPAQFPKYQNLTKKRA